MFILFVNWKNFLLQPKEQLDAFHVSCLCSNDKKITTLHMATGGYTHIQAKTM